MSETKSPNKKRPRRSLSFSKHKKNETKSTNSGPQGSRSIVSFFNNVPPAKLACPACGEMVPRYGINKHMDEMCQKLQVGDDVSLTTDTVTTGVQEESLPALNLKAENSSSPLRVQNLDSNVTKKSPDQQCENVTEQTSPYFKKDKNILRLSAEEQPQTVKTISLGSLASKLSKKHHDRDGSSIQQYEVPSLPQNTKDVDTEFADHTGDIPYSNSSQKENQLLSIPEQGNAERIVVGTCSEDTVDMTIPVLETKSTLLCSGNDAHSSCSGISSEIGCDSVKEGNEKNEKQDFAGRCLELSSRDLRLETVAYLESSNLTNIFESSSNMKSVNDEIQSVFMDSMDSDSEMLPVEEKLNVVCTESMKLSVEAELCSSSPVLPSAIQTNNADNIATDTLRQPYYLRNFLLVLQAVLENEDDRMLFDDEDFRSINAFQQLSVAGQKLYVRLFQRKLNWIKVNKLDYSEIGSDLVPIIEELVRGYFLQSESELEDVSEALDLLSAPELKILAKAFHLENANAQKQQLIQGFLKLAKQRSVFSFSKKQPSTAAVILKRAKELIGPCVRICRSPRAVFSRLLMLFSLSDSTEEEDAAYGGQNQLFTVLMVNMGRLAFPNYVVNRKTKIFQNREDLIRYEVSRHMLNDIMVAMVNGHWEEAYQLYRTSKETWEELKHSTSLGCHEKLPLYLRCYTVGWVYTRIMSRGVEILQRLRMYEEAVEELRNLLSQNVYCLDSRGRWWDRLALNLHQHLKQTEKAIDCIKKGLSDPAVRTGHQLSLYQRALRMRDSPSCKKFHSLLQNLPEITVKDVKHVTIKGKLFPQMGMGKSVFLIEDAGVEEGCEESSSAVLCSVEELALAHYRQQGFDQGIHGEGSTFATLYGLLMWDVIFMAGIPDVFRNAYQAFPLDLYTDTFYENRRAAIEERLKLLQEASPEVLQQLVADVWSSQEGRAAALICWERFSSLQQAQNLVCCLGGPFLSGVCGRLAKDLRHCRGGLPDLVVWSSQNNSCKLVEVKGPSDRLSFKQMIWLDELSKLGADVEVCHVTAVGARSTRLS